MRIGVTPWRGAVGQTAAAIAAQARDAERLGFESLWIPESHFAGTATVPAPLLLLAAAAAGSSTLLLGTTSWLITLRHPLLAAEQVAVLDQLCAGRLVLGLGRGFQPDMLAAFEVPPGRKRAIFESNLEMMKRAWVGAPVAMGETTVRLAPLPVQQPHPPLWMAAFGPLALAQAGRLGMPYLASPLESPAELQLNRRHLLQAAAAAGVAPAPEFPVMRTVLVCPDGGAHAALRGRVLDALRASGRVADDESLPQRVLVGTATEVHDRLCALAADCAVTHVVATRPRGIELPDALVEGAMERLAAVAAGVQTL